MLRGIAGVIRGSNINRVTVRRVYNFVTPLHYNSVINSRKRNILALTHPRQEVKSYSVSLMDRQASSVQVRQTELEERYSDGEKNEQEYDSLGKVEECGGGTSGEIKAGVDKYHYLSHGYSTEIFKIRLGNLPTNMGYRVNVQYLL